MLNCSRKWLLFMYIHQTSGSELWSRKVELTLVHSYVLIGLIIKLLVIMTNWRF